MVWEIDLFKIDVVSIIYVCYVVVFYEGNGDYLDGNGKCFYLMSFGFNFEVKVVLEMI